MFYRSFSTSAYWLAALVLPFALTGCTESEQEEKRPPSIAGLYSSHTAGPGDFSDEGLTIVDHSGEIITLLPEGGYTRGKVWLDHGDIVGNLEVWSGGTYWSSAHLSGVRDHDGAMSGHLHPSGGPPLAFLFEPQSRLYRQPSALSHVTDTWSEWNAQAGIQTTFTVDYDGFISGSDSSGCVYSGQVSTPDRDKNLYRVSVTAEACHRSEAAKVEGFYTGFAVLVDGNADGYPEQWVVMMDNRRVPVVYVFNR